MAKHIIDDHPRSCGARTARYVRFERLLAGWTDHPAVRGLLRRKRGIYGASRMRQFLRIARETAR